MNEYILAMQAPQEEPMQLTVNCLNLKRTSILKAITSSHTQSS